MTVAGKTGTAQRSGKINPVDEEEYIKNHLGAIAPSLSWADIQKEKKRLMETYPDIYSSRHTAVRRAVMNLSGGKVTAATSDRYKANYDNFAGRQSKDCRCSYDCTRRYGGQRRSCCQGSHG